MPFDLSTAQPVSSGFDLSTAKPVGAPEAPAAPAASEGMPSGREPDNSAAQWLGLANRVLAPYVTAAGAGAVAGAPVLGVGAIPGAAMGVTALGLGDIGTSLYNLGAGYFGGTRAPLPSETIQNAYEAAGIGRKPVTTGQKIATSALSGAISGFVPAKALNELAPMVNSPVTRNVVNELAAKPGAQAAVGAGAVMAPEILRAAGVEDPRLLALSSVAGGAAGGKVAGVAGRRGQAFENTTARLYDKVMGKPTASTEELKAVASDMYDTARASGVSYSAKSYDDFVKGVENNLTGQGYSPKFDPVVKDVIGRLDEYRAQGQTPSITELMRVRQAIARSKVNPDPDVRRVAGDVVDRIDDFIERPPSGAIVSGDPAGLDALEKGRVAWGKMRKSETIEDILANADLNKPNAANIIRSEFTQLAKNKKRMLRFNEEEQAAIRDIASGNAAPKTLTIIGKLAPGVDLKGLAISGLLAGGAYYEGASPWEAAALGSVGLGAKGLTNYFSKRNVNNLAAGIRRGDVQAPYNVQPNTMVSPISRQFLDALANQNSLAGQ